MAIFITALAINEWLFARLEFARGINWIYLPAGVRLLCTLLFAGAGAFGLLLVSWLVCFFYIFPDDVIRSLMGGILASLAPYLVYRWAAHRYGLQASLANLTSKRLLLLTVIYAAASPLLHHLWFWMHGDKDNFASGVFVMFMGDLCGSLIVIYAAKALLAILAHGGATSD